MSVFCFVVSTVNLRSYRIRLNRLYRRSPAGKRSGGGVQADDQLYLDGRVERKLRDANGAPGVQAGVTEDLPEKLRGAVQNPGLAVETGGGGYEARDLHHVAQVVQAAGPLGGGGEGVQGAEPGAFLRVFWGDRVAHLAGAVELAAREGELAGGEDQGARSGGGDVGACGCCDRGEFDAEFLQAGGGRHLAEGLLVLAGVVDQGEARVEGLPCGCLADDDRVVAGASPVHHAKVEVGQTVEEVGGAARGEAVGDAAELVRVLAARLAEVGGDVDLVVAQDAKGESLAPQDDVVGVAVVANGDGHAGRAFRGLHHPGGGHRVGLAPAAGPEHVDPVGQVAEGVEYGVTVLGVPVQISPLGSSEGILPRVGIHLRPMKSPGGSRACP